MTIAASEFGLQDVEVLSRTEEYRGFFAIDKYSIRHRLHGGGWSAAFSRELFLRDAAAGMLLYDPDLDSVVLVEQFRIGAIVDAGASGCSPWLLEIVAGIIAADESAAELARREAMEEAGCEVRDMVHITDYYNSPGGSNERISLFCGRVDASVAGGIHGLEEECEDILVRVLSFDEAWQALSLGRMNNAMAIIAMQWLFINKQALRARWSGGGETLGDE
jgi:ADP-ribose pyrophosphatase